MRRKDLQSQDRINWASASWTSGASHCGHHCRFLAERGKPEARLPYVGRKEPFTGTPHSSQEQVPSPTSPALSHLGGGTLKTASLQATSPESREDKAVPTGG